jgi:hypothetical protein
MGAGTTATTQTDVFQQAAPSKVDILVVMDNSGSMSQAHALVKQNIGTLLNEAQAQQVDYHIAVTTTGLIPAPSGWAACPGGAQGGEAGRFFPVDNSSPRIITSATPNAAQVLANNVDVGVCHWWEESFEAARLALTPPLVDHAKDPGTPWPSDGNLGFYRQDAKLALLFISDDDDESGPTVASYEAALLALKNGDPSMLTASAIAGPVDTSCPLSTGPAPRYLQMAHDLGGAFVSICSPDWTAAFVKVAGSSFGPQSVFKLSMPATNPPGVQVQVNGLAVTTGWTYQPATNSVVFDPAQVPAVGSTVSITYNLGC